MDTSTNRQQEPHEPQQPQQQEPQVIDGVNKSDCKAPAPIASAPACTHAHALLDEHNQQLVIGDTSSLDDPMEGTTPTNDLLQIDLHGDIDNDKGRARVDAAMNTLGQGIANTANDFSKPLKHPHTCKIFELFGFHTPNFFAPMGPTKKGVRTKSHVVFNVAATVTDADTGTCTGTGAGTGTGTGTGNGSDVDTRSTLLPEGGFPRKPGSWHFDPISRLYHHRPSINRQDLKAPAMAPSQDEPSKVPGHVSIELGGETLAEASLVSLEQVHLPVAFESTRSLATRDASSHGNAKWQAIVVVTIVLIVVSIAILVTTLLVGDEQDPTSSSSDLTKIANSTMPMDLLSPSSDSTNTTNSTPLMDLLPVYTRMAINETGSPQAEAYNWMMNDPYRTTYSEKRLIQRYALATLYYATNGTFWKNNTGWLNYNVSECDWHFSTDRSLISSKVGTLSSGVSFLSEGDLISMISMLGEGFGGVPVQLLLPFLLNNPKLPCFPFDHEEYDNETMRMLLLHDNNLEGRLPPEMYLLTSMQIIVLFANEKLQGSTISPLIGNLSKLILLLIDSCELVGEIPTELGMATKLRAITVSNNALNGTIPSELFQPTKLFALNLEMNKLNGEVPSEIGLASRNLMQVYLGRNQLARIPSEVGLMSNLTSFVVNDNSFTTFPTEVWPMASSLGLFLLNDNPLEMEKVPAEVLASWCYIAGSIPTEIGRLNGLTEELICQSCVGCQVTGTLPTQLGLLTALTSLIVEGTGLDGPLPTELGLMTSLQKLSLMSNQFSGALPSELGLMTGLLSLNLASNIFMGPVPSELSLLSSLSWLNLLYNNLTGPLPSEMGLLTGLHPMQLANNTVNASMP